MVVVDEIVLTFHISILFAPTRELYPPNSVCVVSILRIDLAVVVQVCHRNDAQKKQQDVGLLLWSCDEEEDGTSCSESLCY